MTKNKYLIDYENAHWCGGQLYVVVNAESADEAQYLAENHMEECQRELFSDEYGDSVNGGDEEYADECAVSINSVEFLDENNEHWKFYKDPSQASFYPEI